MPITITSDEAKVVASLLELYEAAWADGNHRKGCLCQFCEELEKAGNHDFRLFDSLSKKVGREKPSHDTDPA